MAHLKTLLCLRFITSEFGSDVLLLVDRGIPCEAHTEVFSAHTTNQPGEVALQKAVDKYAAYINTAYQSIRNVVYEMPGRRRVNGYKINHEWRNHMMNSFFKELVHIIAMEAEEIALQER